MNSQKGEMIIATSSSIAIIPEIKQMNLNMGRPASWGCNFISTIWYAIYNCNHDEKQDYSN